MSKTIPSEDLRWAKLNADPTCRTCGKTKTVADFPRRAVDYCCNDCRRIYAIELYHRTRAAMTKAQLAELKNKINERQKQRRKNAIARMDPEKLLDWRKKLNADNMARRNEVRDKVYQAYGGYKCSCCGESERLFLSIDHVNNDGSKHRKESNIRCGEQLYRWIINHGYPPDFQILCMNCQWGKRNNKGVCPHQVTCNDYSARK